MIKNPHRQGNRAALSSRQVAAFDASNVFAGSKWFGLSDSKRYDAVQLQMSVGIMNKQYPRSAAGKQLLRPSELNEPLSSEARLKNNTRYIYFKEIARGGKCLIQSCKDLHLGRVVCYKTLRPELADDPYEQKLFLREARITATLQHPNTAPVYEVGFDSRGHYYFTMKLVSGTTLRETLDKIIEGATRWDLHRLIDVIIEVAQVLNYAHAHRVAHCDVKPENIVLGDFGEVLLLDWGIAKLLDEEGESELSVLPDRGFGKKRRPVQASPLYMSPEQVIGDSVDARTDIYSLGAILFEILTLQKLAWGDTLEEILQNTLQRPAPAPSVIAAERAIPSTLESVCLRCLQKDPNHRIQTALELIHELLYWMHVDSLFRPF
jgi:serine/threonine-protein kinase